MKILQSALLFLFLFLIIIQLDAEVLSFPPITYEQSFTENEPFPSLYGWLDLRQHAPGEAEISPAWILDSGLIFTIYSRENITIEVMSRHVFLNRLDPARYWLFWPLSIFTDLRLSVVFKIFDFTSRISFQHDCKHDIEANFGRVVIHESINLELFHQPYTIQWPLQDISTLFDGNILMRFHFKPLFQNVSVAEPDIFCLTLCGEIDPVMVNNVYALFLQGELNMLVRDTDSDVNISRPFAFDWSIKGGVRVFKRQNGLAIYAELESLSDDWITVAPETQILFSFGMLMYIQ